MKDSCSCGNWGRWNDVPGQKTPPCCRRLTIAAVHSFIAFLGNHTIPYSLSGGTLLGAVRCGGIISYEYDADFNLMVSSTAGKAILKRWVMRSDIFAVTHVTGLPWGTEPKHNGQTGDVHFDIGVIPRQPTVPCMFENKMAQCRADYDRDLTESYGHDWRIPKRWCDWSKGILCDQIDEFEQRRCVNYTLPRV